MATPDANKTTAPATFGLPIPRSAAGRRCADQHFGAWAVEPRWFQQALAAVRAGTWKPAEPRADWDDDDADDASDPGEGNGYAVVNRVAVVQMNGQMTKRGSSFGGCSTVATRKAIRTAVADPFVDGILLVISSPGGTVAGTVELADDVAAAAKVKPVDAHIADIGCSAAYWVASQCRNVSANAVALVGSVGVMGILEDDTGLQEQMGVKLTVVSTGEFKGLGVDGAVTAAYVADEQRLAEGLNVPFRAAVTAGRGARIKDMAAVDSGRVYVAADALGIGLIDRVASLDVTMADLTSEIQTMTEQEFNAHVAANPAAVQQFIDRGHQAGHAAGRTAGHAEGRAEGVQAERDRFAELADMAGEHPAFVVEQFRAGANIPTAAKAYAALVKREAQQAKTLDPSNGVTALNVPKVETAAAVAADPEQAWAANVNGVQQQFAKKEHFLAFARRESRLAALSN